MSVFIIIASMMPRDLAKDITDMGGKKIDVDELTKVSRRHTMVDGERLYHESPYLADYLQWLTREISWKDIQKTYGVPFNIPTDHVIPDERIVIELWSPQAILKLVETTVIQRRGKKEL